LSSPKPTSFFPQFCCIQFGKFIDLVLALEAEAAALCCRQNKKEFQFKPGTKYMVVDCGGGTVDIVIHEIDKDGMAK
jgi:hypothetical protein